MSGGRFEPEYLRMCFPVKHLRLGIKIVKKTRICSILALCSMFLLGQELVCIFEKRLALLQTEPEVELNHDLRQD